MQLMNTKQDLIKRLFEIKAIQTGEFKLVSGIMSPVYIDLRRIISFPEVYQYIVDLLGQEIAGYDFHHIVGVPYAALPLASGIALLYHKSMIMPRKEIKDHGTPCAIEGVFNKGDTAIIVEDIVTSGASIERTIETLKQAGVSAQDVIVFMDRQQGAEKRLAKKGVTLRSVCKLSDALSTLQQEGYLDESAVTKITNFINEHQF